MPLRNTIIPNINIPAQRGWCLKYVDDGIDAPARKPSAKASFEQEQRNGNITFDLPVGVWLAGYLAFNKGAYTQLGHVFWAYKHSDGRMEIHDSEVHGGGRSKPYGSIAEILAWFGAYAPSFIGYTHGIDGKHLVESYEEPKPAPAPEPTPQPAPPVDNSPKIGDRVTTTATNDAGNGLTLNLAIINDGQSVWTENNSKGNAVLRKGGVVRCQVPINSLKKA